MWSARAVDRKEAEQWRDNLRKSDDVPWTHDPVDLVQFDAGSATMRSSAAEMRQELERADIGDRIWFAGYADSPGSGEAPVGTARADAVVDACSPLATLDPDGAVDMVPQPPPGQMLRDTAGSIFLISYRADGVEVVVVNGLARLQEDLLAGIRKGEADVVRKELPEDVPLRQSADDLSLLDDDEVDEARTSSSPRSRRTWGSSGPTAPSSKAWCG